MTDPWTGAHVEIQYGMIQIEGTVLSWDDRGLSVEHDCGGVSFLPWFCTITISSMRRRHDHRDPS